MQHVIISKYGEKETIWVSESYLIDRTGVSSEYLRKVARPYYNRHGHTWRWDKKGGKFYYDYDKIPNKSPNYYQTSVGTRKEVLGMGEGWGVSSDEVLKIGRENIEKRFREEQEYKMTIATGWYARHRHEHPIELAEAWAWADFIKIYANKDSRLWIQLGLEKIQDVYTIITNILREKRLWGMRISNEIGLRNKLKGFFEIGEIEKQYEYFVHKAYGNEHAKQDNRLVKQMAIVLRAMGQNYSDQWIVRRLGYICEQTGLKMPSERTMEDFLNSKEVQTITEESRYGIKGRRRRITNGTIPIAQPMFASDCWQMDGTRVNMIAHEAEVVDKKTGEVTKVMKFLYIVIVRDVMSRAILGWSYGYEENHAMYVNALQMAYETAGHLPYELVYDRFPGYNTEQWMGVEHQLRKLGVRLTKTSGATGKAQVERAFGTLQSIFMIDTPWYYGEGIRSTRRYAHRSEEYLKKIKKEAKDIGYDYDKACDSMDGVIERYNKTVINEYRKCNIADSPQQLWDNDSKLNAIRVEAWQGIWMFGLRKTLQVNDGLLCTKILGNKVFYRIEDYNIIKSHKKVVLCYDLRNWSTVMIFDEQGIPIGEIKEVEPVQVYGPNADMGAMSRERAKSRRIADKARQELEEVVNEVRREIGDEVAILMPTVTPKKQLEMAETAMVEQPYNDDEEPTIDIAAHFKKQISGQ